jgi:hypothetical protein
MLYLCAAQLLAACSTSSCNQERMHSIVGHLLQAAYQAAARTDGDAIPWA